MSKHVGIVACSAEGAALCYLTLCKEAAIMMGEHMHPEVSVHTYPLGEYMKGIGTGNWEQVAELMLRSVGNLSKIGAQFAICPDNTIHQAFDLVITKSCRIPDESDREQIDKIIFDELVNGKFMEKSRGYFNTVIQKLKEQGCDAAILGCTEIPLIVDPKDCPLPTLDSTRLLAKAALRKALEDG